MCSSSSTASTNGLGRSFCTRRRYPWPGTTSRRVVLSDLPGEAEDGPSACENAAGHGCRRAQREHNDNPRSTTDHLVAGVRPVLRVAAPAHERLLLFDPMATSRQLTVDVVIPVYNEQAVAARVHRPAPRLPVDELPIHLAGHHRRQRVHRCHVGRRLPARPGPARRARAAPRRQGPRPGPAGRVVGQRRRGGRVHGRGSVHRPRRPPAAGRAAGVRAQRHGHRHAAGEHGPGQPGTSARGGVAGLQPAAAGGAPRRLLRRPVRVQGRAHGRRQGPAAAGRGSGLVLRHRAARARRAQRHAHPRGARRLGRRPRLARPHRLHGARRPAWGLAAPAQLRSWRRRAARTAERHAARVEASDAGAARPLRVDRGSVHRRLRRAVPAAARLGRAGGRRRDRPRGVHDREHRGQSPAHVQPAWTHPAGAPATPWPHRRAAAAGH